MFIAIILSLTQVAVPADTLRLSLAAAVERASESNPSLRAERAEARMAAEAPKEASRAFLPTLQLGVQGLRTTDPVAVFGLRLRQENFRMEDLGLDPLNRPAPYSGFNSSATVQLPIFAPEGLFGHAAARRAAEARAAAAERAAGATTFFVTQAYWDAQLAQRRTEALDAALQAARAHATQAEALQQQGVVTGLDARLARVKAAEVEIQLLAATAVAGNALSALRTQLALPDATPIALTDSLLGRGTAVCETSPATCEVAERGDLDALRLGSEAAAAAVRSAWAKNLPSIALFGSAAYYGQSSPWGTGSGDWTVGVGVTWTPFAGLSGVGAVRRAKAEQQATLARREAAERQAQLEILSAERMLAAADERVTVAEAADTEAEQALEQARLRYRTGVSSITELLDVQAAATTTTLSLLAARRDLFVAQAALDFAFGVYDR
jgi:outer membrane protein TolC